MSICFSPIRFCSSLFFRRRLSMPNTISSCIPPHATPAPMAVVAPKAATSPVPPPIPVSTGSWHCLLPLCFHSTSSPPFPCLHLPAYATIKKLLFSFHFSIPSLPSSTCIGFWSPQLIFWALGFFWWTLKALSCDLILGLNWFMWALSSIYWV